mgnify:CR=1 FL=1
MDLQRTQMRCSMLEVTDAAREKLEEFLTKEDLDSAFRVYMTYG